MKNTQGFIVHPGMTYNNKYHASYGKDKNKTNKSFKTLADAKKYLAKKNTSTALYDSPSGVKIVKTTMVKRKIVSRAKPSGMPRWGMFGGY